MVLFQSCFALLVAVVATSSCVSEAANLRQDPRSLQTYQQPSEFLPAMLARVNQERAAVGPPFHFCVRTRSYSRRLNFTPTIWQPKDYMAHEGSDGSTMSQRITQLGYGWSAVGENVAAGQEDVDAVMDAWMNSPEHKHNILGSFTMLGVAYGFREGITYEHYWTQDLGSGDNESYDSNPSTDSNNQKQENQSPGQVQGEADTEETPVPKTSVHVTESPETPCPNKETTEAPVQEANDTPVQEATGEEEIIPTSEDFVVEEPTQRSVDEPETPGKVSPVQDCDPQF